jgi:DNA polymerase III psi subunit
MANLNSHPWQQYLEKVLGVRSMLWPQSKEVDLPSEEKAHPTLIVASNAQTAADYELLEKILQATKLEAWKILIVDSLEQAKSRMSHENQTLFVFGAEGLANSEPKNIFVFPNLAEIRSNESLKRPVWEKIKIALQNIV